MSPRTKAVNASEGSAAENLAPPLPIDSGQILIVGKLLGCREGHAGELIEPSERKFCRQRASIGMVFQHFNLFHNLTAIQNIMEAPMVVQRLSRAAARERAVDALESVGLSRFQGSYPSQLWGGQQQRVAIARAPAVQPRLMLFDEPTSMVDPELVGEVPRHAASCPCRDYDDCRNPLAGIRT